MRNLIAFTFGILFLSFGVAQANEGGNDLRPARFNCRYMSQDSSKDKTCPHTCTAQAVASHYNLDGIPTNQDGKNLLRVECDGMRIYEDGARHTNYIPHGVEFLSAMDGNPSIKYPSRHPHHQLNFVTSSWINVNGHVLEGYCSVDILLTGTN